MRPARAPSPSHSPLSGPRGAVVSVVRSASGRPGRGLGSLPAADPEGEHLEAGGIERGQHPREQGRPAEPAPPDTGVERRRHHPLLGPRRAQRRHRGQGQGADGEQQGGPAQARRGRRGMGPVRAGEAEVEPKPAQIARSGRVKRHPGAEEEQRLERRVGDQVGPRDAGRSGADGDQHQADLGRGRRGQSSLEVGLDRRHDAARPHGGDAEAGDRRGEPGGAARRGEGRSEPDQGVGAGRHHGRRVEQRRDRRRAGHGREQPGRERPLGGLGGRRQQQPGRRRVEGDAAQGAERPVVERPGAGPGRGGGEVEPQVAEAGGEERLGGGPAVGGVPVVVADQGPRADAHQLPGDEQGEQIAGQHQQLHGADEDQQPGEQPGQALAPLGAAGVGDDRRRDQGDEHRHHPGEAFEGEAAGEPGAPSPGDLERRGAGASTSDECDQCDRRRSGRDHPGERDPTEGTFRGSARLGLGSGTRSGQLPPGGQPGPHQHRRGARRRQTGKQPEAHRSSSSTCSVISALRMR